MKRCVHCGAEYTDDSLSYCAIDGNALVSAERKQDSSAETLDLPYKDPKLPTDQDCLHELNRFFKIGRIIGRDFYFYGVTKSRPQLIPLGGYQLTEIQSEIAREKRNKLAELRSKSDSEKEFQYRNDLHAILKGNPIWTETGIFLPYEELDYAGLWALRETGQRPQVISVSAILFCHELKILYLHRRPPNAATHPHELHTFGGAFMPQASGLRLKDKDLFDTLQRKLKEEAVGINVTIKTDTTMILAKETDTGFIQLVIPINIPASEDAGIQSPAGGGATMKFLFSSLMEAMNEPEIPWVATGKAQVLSWLALGAPNCDASFEFVNTLSPRALFDEITKNK